MQCIKRFPRSRTKRMRAFAKCLASQNASHIKPQAALFFHRPSLPEIRRNALCRLTPDIMKAFPLPKFAEYAMHKAPSPLPNKTDACIRKALWQAKPLPYQTASRAFLPLAFIAGNSLKRLPASQLPTSPKALSSKIRQSAPAGRLSALRNPSRLGLPDVQIQSMLPPYRTPGLPQRPASLNLRIPSLCQSILVLPAQNGFPQRLFPRMSASFFQIPSSRVLSHSCLRPLLRTMARGAPARFGGKGAAALRCQIQSALTDGLLTRKSPHWYTPSPSVSTRYRAEM